MPATDHHHLVQQHVAIVVDKDITSRYNGLLAISHCNKNFSRPNIIDIIHVMTSVQCSSASSSISEPLVVLEKEVWEEGCTQVINLLVHSLQVHE